MHRQLKVASIAVIALLAVLLTLGWAAPSLSEKIHLKLGSARYGELLRHALRRLEGHPSLETVLHPILFSIQRTIERPVPSIALPTLGKGQQKIGLPPQRYDKIGRPIQAVHAQEETREPTSTIQVDSTASLTTAVARATPGDVIELAPGSYALRRSITTPTPGTADQPIIVRARLPGSVVIDDFAEIAFRITQPFWIFENLRIQGKCAQQDDCEHAFQIVGSARSTVLRNNSLQDFNAHIKVNGAGGVWPDFGLLQHNTLNNNAPRNTSRSVTPFDLVGASSWQVVDNLVSNFVKSDGNRVSFGLFMKGGGEYGRFERNLVICTSMNISQPGVRVGISFGGGGTDPRLCRMPGCEYEHSRGVATNNLVAHCNDSGLDANRSQHVTFAHNTLVNTAGIDARGTNSDVLAYANLMDGVLRARDTSTIKLQYNDFAPPRHFTPMIDELEFAWLRTPERIPKWQGTSADFCKLARQDGSLPGALADAESIKACQDP